MKTIGVIGGMSWESTLEYYRIMNEEVKARLGGFHSARILLYSVDFEEVERLQHRGAWDELTELMVDAGRRVERGGADILVIATNTMHKMAGAVEEAVSIPLLHIADVTGEAVRARGLKRVALLGTRFTMEQDFYRARLEDMFGLDVLIPDEEDRRAIHEILYRELCLGLIKDQSKATFRRIIAGLAGRGAEGVILGCTEIPLIVEPQDYDLPLFDTTTLHARGAVDFALSRDGETI